MPAPVLRAKCSACGTEATCECNAPYVPAGERAAAAVAASPEKSNRAIAAEIGVSDKTVAAARKATAEHSAVPATRTGRDGKARRMPAAKPNIGRVDPRALNVEGHERGEHYPRIDELLNDLLATIEGKSQAWDIFSIEQKRSVSGESERVKKACNALHRILREMHS